MTHEIIGAAIEVSKALGNGLLESAYHGYLLHKLVRLRLDVLSQPTMPVTIDGIRIAVTFRPDFVVENKVIVELKTVTTIGPVHKAQLLTYLRFSGLHTGLLMNFHAYPFTDGIVCMVL